jgi:hypothetical protein
MTATGHVVRQRCQPHPHSQRPNQLPQNSSRCFLLTCVQSGSPNDIVANRRTVKKSRFDAYRGVQGHPFMRTIGPGRISPRQFFSQLRLENGAIKMVVATNITWGHNDGKGRPHSNSYRRLSYKASAIHSNSSNLCQCALEFFEERLMFDYGSY